MLREQLRLIALQLIDAGNADDEIKAGKALASLFSSLPADQGQSLKTATTTSGGLALSPSDAAACVDEYVRTARFVKGTWLALRELQQRFPGEKLNILYAGCGPYATILLPLLTLFKTGEAEVTMLDIHAYSVNAVSKLLDLFDLREHVGEVLAADAITYRHPEQKPLHMVVSETMLHALISEPQVAITANLAPQVTKNGLLIPEEISVDLGHSFFAYEPKIDPPGQSLPEVKPGRPAPGVMLGNIVSLSVSGFQYTPEQFSTGWFPVPDNFADNPDICLFTRVKIFGDVHLGLAESTITNPYCVQSFYNLAGKSQYKLHYVLNPSSSLGLGWRLEAQ